ncbi:MULTISPECIES: hypothetical protein [Acinetobacter]|uniref:Uncharacterized protein n=1 Tax=Acinetobacter baylyi TaxID=202950 RepID=A0ABU0V0F2_ACIBI|nr:MULTISPECIES: hypothetical protein [Acinetobacter]ENV53326.1 hypothetical protein F952_02387 [Acinetobacter baylyi DSM 14961 = CIP 107474]MDQ1210176.1 hypothetical protein [Acinetobacter baylyi]MDR6106229.1 hypothetical protein [Acinetobacter baylyi]MDR6187045.1 hypothetical protein [Acinetobacter baylyi]UXJ58653.1 hypothetical protein N5P16_06665 [Acinetobacter baylyi]
MKIIPEQTTNLIQLSGQQRIKLDTAAICFFALGMFLAAMIIHHLGFFPV